MKKQVIGILLCAILLIAMLQGKVYASNGIEAWDGSVATEFAGGDGTEHNPYQIANGAQLAYLAKIVNDGESCKNDYFLLTKDIDLNNKPWNPIGVLDVSSSLEDNDTLAFEGTFDGDYHTISNMMIGTQEAPMESFACGLFCVMNGEMKNTNLAKATIYSSAKMYYVEEAGFSIPTGMYGGMFGTLDGKVSNCNVTDLLMVTKSQFAIIYAVGGFAGSIGEKAEVSDCSASGTIRDTSELIATIGGFVGMQYPHSSIEYCAANVNVSSAKKESGILLGGFVGAGLDGTNPETIINHCCATGDVSGGTGAGGFAGSVTSLNLANSYATGNVSNSHFGSSFAANDASEDEPAKLGTLKNCYATGLVTGILAPFAFLTQVEDAPSSTLTNCFYNSANTPAVTETTVGKTMSEMQEAGFVDILNNGDSSNGWIKSNTTPYCGAEPGDYSKVNEQIARANALNPDDYIDFTAVPKAIAKVIAGRNLHQQEKVDGYAKEIKDAIDALVAKPIESTKPSETPAPSVSPSVEPKQETSDEKKSDTKKKTKKKTTKKATTETEETTTRTTTQTTTRTTTQESDSEESETEEEKTQAAESQDDEGTIVEDREPVVTEQDEPDTDNENKAANKDGETTNRKSNGNIWLWVILAIAGIGVGGFLLFFIFRKKKKDAKDK